MLGRDSSSLIHKESGGPIKVVYELGGFFWSYIGRINCGSHVANPSTTFHLPNGKSSVASTLSGVPSKHAVSGRAAPILGQECTRFQVGWIGRSKHRVAFNQVVKAIDQRNKEWLPTYTFKES